jgi:alkylated DNA repair dioxygenase AlkB
MSRLELSHDAWIELREGWLTPEEAELLWRGLLEQLGWEQRHIVLFGKRILQPRLIAWAGELPYRYSGQTLAPRPWPAPVLELRRRVNEATGLEFNHVLINRYRDGNDSMGYHSDDEPELGPDPPVACVSLGQSRRFSLRARGTSSGERPRSVTLTAGSLLLMGGTCQRHYRHAIPREANRPLEERVSLTFRRLLRAP